MNNGEKQAVRVERKQRKTEAGFMTSLFPEAEGISMNMVYSQKEIMQHCLERLFFPNQFCSF